MSQRAEIPVGKLGLLATLYFSQGLPFGFFSQALPTLMRQQGFSLEKIGLTYLLVAPWMLKFLWAPFVERHYSTRWGRRRSWILPLQVAAAGTMAALAWADPAQGIYWLIAGVFATNLIAATHDISTDGFAVDLLNAKERGWGNGVQVAGYRLGMIFGGSALLVAFERWGWSATFELAAATLLLASVAIALHREAPAPALNSEQAPKVLDALAHFLRDPTRRRWLLILALYKSGDYVGTSMLRPFFVDRGQTLTDIAFLLGTLGFGAGLLGAVVGGWTMSRFDRWASLRVLGGLQALSVASYVLCVDPDAATWRIWLPICFEHFATGMATVALFTLMMDACREGHAATDYTLQASLVVGATGVAGVLGGLSAARLGYADNYLLGGAVCVLATLATWTVSKHSFEGQTGADVG